MLPNAPKRASYESLETYRRKLQDLADTLRNKQDRAFYRKELKRRARYYETLSKKESPDHTVSEHFAELSRLHLEELERFGLEPAPKQRKQSLNTVPLSYPDFSTSLSHRMHFIGSGSLRRERTAVLAQHADALSSQTSPNGDVLISVAVGPNHVQLFERLVESIGESGLTLQWGKNGGFYGYIDQYAYFREGPDGNNASSPWAKMWGDNFDARKYLWVNGPGPPDPSVKLPKDAPRIPDSLPWDPDPKFQQILLLTNADRLEEAAGLLNEIPLSKKEVLFDEILYLRYLLGQHPRAEDVLYLARTYIKNSSIYELLQDEIETFMLYLNAALTEFGPVPDDFANLDLSGYTQQKAAVDGIENVPKLKDWTSTRAYYVEQCKHVGNSVLPRGRIFVWNPDIAYSAFESIYRDLWPSFVDGENAFRRERAIAEIGKGWVSETTLYNLVKELYPDATHQWRPKFLGGQSVDIFVPSLCLCVEYQGEQHYQPVTKFGGEAGLQETLKRDSKKRARLADRGFKLLEWPYYRPITRSSVRQTLLDITQT